MDDGFAAFCGWCAGCLRIVGLRVGRLRSVLGGRGGAACWLFVSKSDVFKHHLAAGNLQGLGIGRIKPLIGAAMHVDAIAHGADILEEAGYTLGDVAKTTVLLQDIGDFAAMNAVYAGFFTSGMPARVCYQVAALPMGALVEIDAVAAK